MSGVILRDITSYLDYVPVQFRDSPKLNKLITIFLAAIQELEDATILLNDVSTDIRTAEGYQLDIIGKLVGSFREGRDDIAFRLAILFQITINRGSGTVEDCITYLSTVTGANKVKIWDHYPASIIMETDGETLPSDLAASLARVTVGGVRVAGIISVGIDREVFIPTELGVTSTTDLYQGDIFPELSDIEGASNGAGEESMQAGEANAAAGDLLSVVGAEFGITVSEGVFPEVYTIN